MPPVGRRMVLLFFFNDTATTEIYTLSLHDALPILIGCHRPGNYYWSDDLGQNWQPLEGAPSSIEVYRSEEHTSELQSRLHLVCRLLLEKKRPKRYGSVPPGQQVHSCLTTSD